MLEDERLKWKLRRGSKEALATVYEKYIDSMLTLAMGLLNNRATAEDVVQDVFLSFARSARGLKSSGNLRSYLMTGVLNRVRDHHRRLGRQTLRRDATSCISGELTDLSCESADPEQAAILMDQVTQEVGLAQGDMTVKEVAVEVVRQALEAWSQEDYTEAGKLFGGMPPQWFADLDDIRPARILSIGEAESIHDEDRPPYAVRCQYETDSDGRTRTVALTLIVPDVDGQPGRWHVSIRSRDAVPTEAEDLDLEGTDLGMVQGQLSDEEVATAVVRQFFEFAKAGDYDAAGKLLPPGDAENVKEHLSTIKVLRIVSVGPATPMPTQGDNAMVVPCTIEYEEDGQKSSIEIEGLVVPHADRWILHDLKD